MNKLETFAYVALGFVAVICVIALIFGIFSQMPYGIIGPVLLIGIGLLAVKVVIERINNTEDDYYSKKVEK